MTLLIAFALMFALIFTFGIALIVWSALRAKRLPIPARVAIASAGVVFVSVVWGIFASIWHSLHELAKPL